MRANVRMWAAVAAAAMMAACGPPTMSTNAPPALEAPMPMDSTPDPGSAGFKTAGPLPLERAVNAFGVDLLRTLDTGHDNVVVSPLSVSVALAMLANGASEDGRRELEAALHFAGDETERNVALSRLLDDLVAGDDADVRIAQSLWTQAGAPFHDAYIDRVQATFDANLQEVDFAAPETGDTIDAWVSDKTEGLIDEIAADLGLPDPMMVLVLLNATYFHGRWSLPFDPDLTKERSFTRAAGDKVETEFLQMREPQFGYGEDERRQVLRLPYGDDGRFVIDLYLPSVGTPVAAVIPELAAPPVLAEQELDVVAIPKMKLRWSKELKPALQALGVQRLWLEGSLDRLSPDPRTYLSTVVHKTYLQVDEQGTKAAAVTGVGIRTTSARVTPLLSFIADRPFALAIRDTTTGVALFTGVVHDPTA